MTTLDQLDAELNRAQLLEETALAQYKQAQIQMADARETWFSCMDITQRILSTKLKAIKETLSHTASTPALPAPVMEVGAGNFK